MALLRSVTEPHSFDEALQTSKTLIVDFYTPSCVLCKKIEPMLAAVGERLGSDVEIVKVDAEANLGVAARYDVQGVPTVLLIQGGEMKARKTGFMTASMLQQWIAPFLN